MLHLLYKKLLKFYPQEFREQLAESMEQTFSDLCNEKRQTKQSLFGFVLWTFIETTIGICKEHLFLVFPGGAMQTTLKTLGSSMLISLLLILPFMIMEIVNRQNFNEDFPFVLFFGLWISLFAISLILLPIVQAIRTGKQDMANLAPAKKNILLTNPKSALMISVVLILSIVILSFLASPGSNPEGSSVFGIQVASQLIILILLSLAIAAGITARRPIVNTLRTGGSLFAHPIHLLIVVTISILFAIGVISLIVDQWPCFMGIANCD
jgi:hypothetical protein